jgi:hypothetical protein
MKNKRTANSASEAIDILWQEGVFRSWHKFNSIAEILEKRGNNFTKPELGMALRRANFLTRRGAKGSYEYVQRLPAINKEIEKIEDKLFSATLIKRLNADFSEEISDLRWNFGKSGTCSAFLLRKILEKLIFLTFAKNGIGDKLKNTEGKFIGLEGMINLASSEKIDGLPFLMPQTAGKIKSTKFLGDVSAHNPLANVKMETISPQMPYVIIAYEELSKKL